MTRPREGNNPASGCSRAGATRQHNTLFPAATRGVGPTPNKAVMPGPQTTRTRPAGSRG